MEDEFTTPCSVCSEHGNLFCRMCNKRYCWDHACWHLGAAQSSYSNQLDEKSSVSPTTFDFNFNRKENSFNEDDNLSVLEIQQQQDAETQVLVQDQLPVVSEDTDLTQIDEQTLRALYELSLQSARRYRTELERRSAPFARTYFGDRAAEVIGRPVKIPKVNKQHRKLSKSKSAAIAYVLEQAAKGNPTALENLRRLNETKTL